MRAFLLAAVTLTMLAAAPAAAQPTRDHLEAIRHLRLGQENMHAEQWAKAEAEFQAAIKLEPSLEMAHYGLGQVYMATKRYPSAVRAYRACREAFVAANSERAVHDVAAQRALDDQIQGLENEKSSLGSGRGNILSGGQFDIDRQIADLKALQNRSTSMGTIPAWISFVLGSAYFRSGSLADAEREYLEAFRADPNVGETHNNLAVVYLQTGRYHEAHSEIGEAERNGFRVNPQLKADVQHALGKM